MNEQTKTRILKGICWLGVVADAAWTVALIHPPIFAVLTGKEGFAPDLTFRLTMGIGASLMAGWTLLLAWAARDPVPRRGVLLLTACPVIAGLGVVTIIGATQGGTSLWILPKLVLLEGAMVYGYLLARRMA